MYQLNEEEAKNALIFLNRVEIRGSEAPALLRIMQVLSKPINTNEK